MALFIIERNFAAELNLSADDVSAVTEINDRCDVRWLYSFLSADKRKTYCMYEATSPESLREAARQANLPADAIIELGEEIRPEAFRSSGG